MVDVGFGASVTGSPAPKKEEEGYELAAAKGGRSKGEKPGKTPSKKSAKDKKKGKKEKEKEKEKDTRKYLL